MREKLKHNTYSAAPPMMTVIHDQVSRPVVYYVHEEVGNKFKVFHDLLRWGKF